MNDTELVDYIKHDLQMLIVHIDEIKDNEFNTGDDWFIGHKECAEVVLEIIKNRRGV
jgi:hypothetical protein